MTTLSNVIKELLKKRVLIREAINHNLVSYNKVSKILKPEIEKELGKPVKDSAIAMALRRNADKIIKNSRKPTFSYSIETIKTDICYILLEESPNLLHKIKDFYETINFKKGGLLNIIQGNFEVGIITNEKYKQNLLDILFDENVLDVIDNLVSISLTFSEVFLYTPGVIYDVSRFLTWENVNLIDFILTRTEINIIIDDKDFMKTYRILQRFAENKQNTEKLLINVEH